MGELLRHPIRTTCAALTLVGGAIVFVVLFVPIAAAGGGGNEVRGYLNSKGDKFTNKVGVHHPFTIVGKNLNFATEVECWHPSAHHWDSVDNWDMGPDSKTIVNVQAYINCSHGAPSQIRVQFSSGTPDPAYGPMITFT
jgi:hypothetical protein